uniref:LTA synthase family protein n=1 Tax=Agathobacter sp. TaxID=2021311 RepID=UPI004056E06F
MKKFWSTVKEKIFTKKEVEHSEKFHKAMDFLNKYSFVFHALLSFFVVFLVEIISRRSFVSVMTFITESPFAYMYNSFLVFASLTLVYLFKRRAFTRLIISAFWVILGIINGIVLSNRVTPFGFADLHCIPDLLTMTNTSYFTAEQAALVVIGVVIFALFCVVLYIKGPVFKGKIHKMAASCSILAVLFIAIPITTRAAQENNIVESYFANIAQGYENYGFVYSFSSGVIDRGMSKPDNYSEETIDGILETVESEKTETTTTGENGPNIITVLLESFVDPDDYTFMTYSQDPTPTFNYLEENFTSGYLTVPVIGAGTANTEFEILSAMKLEYFGTGEYPYKSVLKDTNCESIASVLKSLGYNTHAVHNNGGNFYSRAHVFSMMGFDSFTSKELMNITEFTPNGGWAEDSILVEETIKTLTSTEGPDFTYTITVGSHGEYPEEIVVEDPYCEVYGLENQALTNQWTYYMHQLNKTDRFIANLIAELETLNEDTIVVFWGDHLPTMGLTEEDMVSGDIYKTKYVTWNNFGLGKEDCDLYAYQLMSDILDAVGIHEGTMVGYHQTQSDNEDFQTYVDGIEQLQYDILYGDRFCYDGIDKYPATDIVMGIDDVAIHDIALSKDGQSYVLTGENFTKWSRVYINGEKTNTSYLSGNELSVNANELQNGDSVVVNQLGSNNTIFRSSNEVMFETFDPTADTLSTENTLTAKPVKVQLDNMITE